MGYLSSFQQRILECIISLSKECGRPVKSSEVASLLKVHPGSVRNAVSTLRILGLVESKKGPFGGYVPTGKALRVYSARDALSTALVTSDGSPSRISSTITVCLTDRSITLEIRDFRNKLFLKKGRKVVVQLGKYIVEGVITDSDRVGRRVVVLVKRIVRARPPIRASSKTKISDLLSLMLEKKAECALILENKRAVGYVNMRRLLRAIMETWNPDLPVKSIASKLPSSMKALRFLRMGYCHFK